MLDDMSQSSSDGIGFDPEKREVSEPKSSGYIGDAPHLTVMNHHPLNCRCEPVRFATATGEEPYQNGGMG